MIPKLYVSARLSQSPAAKVRSLAAVLLLGLSLLTATSSASADDYPEINWTDLLPASDLQALENRPDFIDNIEEGSSADSQAGGPPSGLDVDQSAAWQRYDAALKSTNTRPEFEGRKVKIPGFVVPLDFDDQQNVSEFFLVPFFGACIHVPPPPPNQIVHAQLAAPYALESIYDPVWITGTIHLQTNRNDLGVSSYSIDVKTIQPYYD
ncbi:DUF3299 domain-containing protein [Oceanobacter mangrovi]|uniref:DUF3299 domain-containing protein n=1 Tax=Oceanobacter mangrovi TaxID=2862510 RepID=UPI001C8F08B2|nr:DUF3299 domain-containing protein [Oceanobacter mangrovi]